jgi:hypothetical protein
VFTAETTRVSGRPKKGFAVGGSRGNASTTIVILPTATTTTGRSRGSWTRSRARSDLEASRPIWSPCRAGPTARGRRVGDGRTRATAPTGARGTADLHLAAEEEPPHTAATGPRKAGTTRFRPTGAVGPVAAGTAAPLGTRTGPPVPTLAKCPNRVGPWPTICSGWKCSSPWSDPGAVEELTSARRRLAPMTALAAHSGRVTALPLPLQ